MSARRPAVADVPYDLLHEFPKHADALREIARLRAAGDRLMHILDAMYEPTVDMIPDSVIRAAIEAWQNTRRE